MKKNFEFLKRSICILFIILFFFEIIALADDGDFPLDQEKFYGNVYMNGVIVGQGHLIDARNASGSSKIVSGSDPYTDGNGRYGNNISALFKVSGFLENEIIYFYVDNKSSNTIPFKGKGLTNLDLDIAPVVITIKSPENESINTTGNVNVTVTLDKNGTAQYLNWNGVNYPMIPNTTSQAGTVFYYNMTGLLSGNHSFKVYANSTTNLPNVSETRIITVNRTNTTNLSVNYTTGNVSQTVNISAPSGNATLTIFNGTNATLNANTLTNISIDSLNQVNATYVLSGNDKFMGENLSLGPEGARFTPDIQLRINYTHAQLTAANIVESTLTLKFYNTSSTAWEALTIYEQNTSEDFLIVNLSHFSVIAMMGIPPQSPVITTSSNGGGGGGVKSGENVSNIEVIEKYDMQISKDVLTSYRFTHAKSPIMFVNITGNTSPGVITTAVEVLKDTSTLVKVPPEGLVYKNANIWVGTTGFATPKNIKEALIKFRVNNDWMSTNGFSASDIVLNRWDGSQWIALETREMDTSQEFTFFEAKTNSFSPFAIVGKILEIPGSLSGTAPTKASGLTQQAAMIPTEVGTEPTAIQAGVFLMMAVGIILIVIIAIRVNKFRNLKEKK